MAVAGVCERILRVVERACDGSRYMCAQDEVVHFILSLRADDQKEIYQVLWGRTERRR